MAGSASQTATQSSKGPEAGTLGGATGAPYISAADLNRIKKAISTAPAVVLDDQRLRFYIRILAQQPKFLDFLKGYDLMNGPTKRGNPMSHAEFVAMTTPKELYGSGGIRATELLQYAVTNFLGKTLVKKAVEDIGNAMSDREVREIRERIERELAALHGEPAPQ